MSGNPFDDFRDQFANTDFSAFQQEFDRIFGRQWGQQQRQRASTFDQHIKVMKLVSSWRAKNPMEAQSMTNEQIIKVIAEDEAAKQNRPVIAIRVSATEFYIPLG